MAIGSNGWEGTVTGAYDGSTNIVPGNETEGLPATFQTGYPYIGMPPQVFNNLAKQLTL